jgi:hypothetical protein
VRNETAWERQADHVSRVRVRAKESQTKNSERQSEAAVREVRLSTEPCLTVCTVEDRDTERHVPFGAALRT